ncbi:Protein Ycf2 [Bienertia sinuspersici]
MAQQNTYIKNISPHLGSWTARVRSNYSWALLHIKCNGEAHFQKTSIINLPYQWIISNSTPISEIPKSETKENLIDAHFSLVPFCKLEKYMDLASQNEFASNEGEKINQIIQTQATILGMCLKVISFNGITLAIISSSIFLINIANLETNALQELLQNEEKLQSVINNSQVPSITPMKDPNAADVIQISTLNLLIKFGKLVAICVGGPSTQITIKHSLVKIAQGKNVWQKQVPYLQRSLENLLRRCLE